MSYATVAEISGEFIDTDFTASTQITDTEVDRFCEEISRWIDAQISNKYTVPVVLATSPDAFAILRFITILCVSSRIRKILNADGGNPSESAQNLADKNKAMAEKMIEDIRSGVYDLPDAELGTAIVTQSFNQLNAIDPIFERDGDQW